MECSIKSDAALLLSLTSLPLWLKWGGESDEGEMGPGR